MLDQGLRRMNIVMREPKFSSMQSDLSEYQEVFLFVYFGMSLTAEQPMDPFCISL